MRKKMMMLIGTLLLMVMLCAVPTLACRNRCRYVCPTPEPVTIYQSSSSSGGSIGIERFWMNLNGIDLRVDEDNVFLYNKYPAYINYTNTQYVSIEKYRLLEERVEALESGD